MLEEIKKDLPEFTCLICQKTSDAFQLSVFEDLEFLACQHCGSVTTTPIPDDEFISEYLDSSRTAQLAPFPHNLEKKHFKKHLQDLKAAAQGPKCIDVKCHNGYRTELARMRYFSDITGIDSNPFAIEIAEKRFNKGYFINTSLKDFTDSGEKFDSAICYHGLEYTNSPDEYLQNLLKILNDKAAVYFSLCDGNHFMAPSNFLKWKEVRYPERTHYISREGLDTLLKRNGFKVVKRYRRFLPYQHVIARKQS